MKSRYTNKAIDEEKNKENGAETKKVERSFTFPSHNLVIKASSLEEATKKFNKMTSKKDDNE